MKATELEEQKGAKRREMLALGDNCRGGLTPTVKPGIVRKGFHWELRMKKDNIIYTSNIED